MMRLLFASLCVLCIVALPFVCVSNHADRIEADVYNRTISVMDNMGFGEYLEKVSGRDVVISGGVLSDEERDAIYKVVKAVPGVRAVKNNIYVEGESKREALSLPDDIEGSSPEVPFFHDTSSYWFNIDFDSKGVSLSGFVPDEDTMNAVIASAIGRFGKEHVTSDIEIRKDGAPEGWRVLLLNVILPRLRAFEEASFIVEDRKLSVSGSMPSSRIRRRITSTIAARLHGGYEVEFDIFVPDEEDL